MGLDLDWLDVPGAGVVEESRMLSTVVKVVVGCLQCLDDGGTVDDGLCGLTFVGRKESCSQFNGEEFSGDCRDWPVGGYTSL
jgi:hypothetical protein